MADLVLTRVDSRLIHGQVCIAWTKQANPNRLMVIDDAVANDMFMSRVITLAAPPQYKLEILSVEQAAAGWKKMNWAPENYDSVPECCLGVSCN